MFLLRQHLVPTEKRFVDIADEYEKAGYNDTLPAIMLAIDMDYREIAVATTQSYVDYFPVSKFREYF